MKTCSMCKESKSLGDFYKDKNRRDGLEPRCKPCCKKKYREWQEKNNNLCDDCGKLLSSTTAIFCHFCKGKGARSGVWKGGRSRTPKGYIELSGHRGHPNARKNGSILEHVLVMSSHLGRPLLKGENVHHKNGIKDDNRFENLELWVSHQPSGQRPEDLVAWAHEILERYEA